MSTTTWNPTTHEDYDDVKGKNVFTSDNEQIGTVDQVLHPVDDSTSRDRHYFLVKPGLMNKLTGQDELYVPATKVQMVSEDRLVLEIPKDRVSSENWSKPDDADHFRRR